MKAKGQDVSRLTIGPPDFDASFSTVPDFDVRSTSGSTAPRRAVRRRPAPPRTASRSRARPPGRSRQPAAAPRQRPRRTQPAPSSSDFTPVTTTPEGEPITEEMLNQFKREGTSRRSATWSPPTASAHRSDADCPGPPRPAHQQHFRDTDKDPGSVRTRERPPALCLGLHHGDRRAAGQAGLRRPRGGAVDRRPPGLPVGGAQPAAGRRGRPARTPRAGRRRPAGPGRADRRDPEHHLGAASVAEFGPRLPFLLKVLAAESPLSLQVHPTLDQARAGLCPRGGCRRGPCGPGAQLQG